MPKQKKKFEPKIINKEPDFPAYKKACKKWNVSFDQGIIFTYGDKVYAAADPGRDTVVHEKAHVRQQEAFEGGPDAWWERYLKDDKFRYEQELEAYRVQYRWVKTHIKDHREAFARLRFYANCLSGKMYGEMISYGDAIRAIIKK